MTETLPSAVLRHDGRVVELDLAVVLERSDGPEGGQSPASASSNVTAMNSDMACLLLSVATRWCGSGVAGRQVDGVGGSARASRTPAISAGSGACR